MIEEKNRLYEFGAFRLDAIERRLLRAGQGVAVTAKAFDILLILVENSGHIVAKEDLMKKIWADVNVRESTLAQNIFTLRKILEEDSSGNQYIETVPKYGYRFIAGVKEISNDEFSATSEPQVDRRADGGEQPSDAATERPATTEARPFADGAGKKRRFSHGTTAAILAIFLLAVVLAVGFFLVPESNRQESANDVKRMIVLPLRPVTTDSRDETLEFGMAETLITKLSRIKRIVVLPLAATRKYAGVEQDPLAIGRKLGADFVLEGSLQKKEERIRVTTRLLRVKDGQSLWAKEFDEKSANLFSIQDAISQKITDALALKLTGEEQELLARHETENSEAYQLYLRGRYFWNQRTKEGYDKAIEQFQRALLADPNYAAAYAGLADTYHLLGDYSFLSPQEAFPKAREAAQSAIRLDDTLAEAHTSLAYAKFLYDWDWPSAEREFKIALDLSPSYPTAHQWHSEYQAARGHFEEAKEEIKRAQELDPTSLILGSVEGWIHYIARDYDRAIEQCRKMLKIEADFYPAHFWIGQAHEKKGLYKEAIAEYEMAAKISSDSPEVLASLAHAYASSGRKDEARRILNKLLLLAKQQYISPYFIALIHKGLGDKEQALGWLEKAYEDHSRSMPFLKVDPMLDDLRADARFNNLVQRVEAGGKGE
jgi:DNA-binding winged helix-turn-helix (wHTH) protein/TolB-like protein/Flp pilus assembly protein TadD